MGLRFCCSPRFTMGPRPASITSSTPTLVPPRPRERLFTLRRLYQDQIIRSYLDRIALTDDRITRLRVDAIVNPARFDLLLDEKGTIINEIHEAAGPMLLTECKKLDGCEVGGAKLTDSYKLRRCKYIIHAVGPIYDAKRAEEKAEQLEGCYKYCLSLAVRHKIRSIAFPLISVGRNEYPLDDGIRIAFEAVRDFLSTPESEEMDLIVFVARGEEEMKAFRCLIPFYFPDAA